MEIDMIGIVYMLHSLNRMMQILIVECVRLHLYCEEDTPTVHTVPVPVPLSASG